MELGPLEQLFYTAGYDKIATNLPEYTFYCRNESQAVTVLFVIDCRGGIYISADQYAHMKEKGEEFFRARGVKNIHMLSLVLSNDLQRDRNMCADDSFCWMIDANGRRLVIYENRISDFYGWKGILEDFLAQQPSHADAPETQPQPAVNNILVAVNILLFLICTFTGDLLYNKGMLGLSEIVQHRAYYRMITSMFLHADVQHLFSNMVVLYCIGGIVEKETGHVSYAVIYFLSGIVGNIFSLGFDLLSEGFSVYSQSGGGTYSLGASGAVFGIEGALLLLVLTDHGRVAYITAGRLAFAIFFSLYCGFTSTNIDNAAHIGGVLAGFAVTALIMFMKSWLKTGKDRHSNEN